MMLTTLVLYMKMYELSCNQKFTGGQDHTEAFSREIRTELFILCAVIGCQHSLRLET
jgi:hypothetical protein